MFSFIFLVVCGTLNVVAAIFDPRAGLGGQATSRAERKMGR